MERLRRLLFQVKYEIEDTVPYQYPQNTVKLLSNRNKKTLGRCQRTLWGFDIYLNPKLRECSDELVKSVICHELIHTAPYCFNHRVTFQRYARDVNSLNLGYKIATTNTFEEWGNVAPHKYKIRCVDCGKVFYRERLPKDICHYTHTCGGKIEVERLR